eukprot:TRINITY_DN9382_c0_g1_i2.p1 TRINITY_DN9382_c0_g1~~TRINITY_DN9382_c0_g1_i2.p1  ORF type:complete len:672 (-),score=98.04 TRINITY_DN9382_c0_g1_i2:395-2410(-)
MALQLSAFTGDGAFLAVLLTLAPSAFALRSARTSVGSALKAGDCLTVSATGSKSYRWPVENPALVAPAKLHHNYPVYGNPVEAEFTGDVIGIPIPADFAAGFSLIQSAGDGSNGTTTEQYVLRRMEIRKAAKVPEGIGQVLSHAMELALVHEQVGGSYWANVIIPFTVSGDSTYDLLFPLVYGATMPTQVGQREPMVLSGAQKLMLNASFVGDTSFHHFWTTLPTTCLGRTVQARQFMRRKVLNIGFETYDVLMSTLANAPDYPPFDPAPMTWIVGTCGLDGACSVPSVPDLTTQLTEAYSLRSRAVTEFRERKALMDQKYAALVNGTGNAVELLKEATAARNDLRTADTELKSATTYADQLERWSNESNGANWDADAPQQTLGTTSAPIAPPTSSTAPSASNPSLLDVSQSGSCVSHKLSPVDIETARVVDPGQISLELRQPLTFFWDRSSPVLPLRVGVEHGRVRVRASPGPKSSPLGAVFLGGQQRVFSYVDLMIPGEHAVDGKVGLVELQLVHLPPSGAVYPAVAISLRLDIGRQDNSWLEALLQERLISGSEVLVNGTHLTEVHQLFANNSVERYFRYDGTLTSPPCLSAQWFVVEATGELSQRQLAILSKSVASLDDGKSFGTESHQRFRSNLVAFGTPRLVTKASVAGFDAAPRKISHRKHVSV